MAYTRFGSSVWDWDPFIALPNDGRLLWIALYTSEEAKRLMMPGLWHGSINAMADASHMPADEVLRALDKLLEHEMVEFDQKNRVLRLTCLPDAGESPVNGNVIRAWWKKFKGVPVCPVRDAHVTTLLWLMEEWVRENPDKHLSPGHIATWNETFAHITIPAARRRGVRRLIDNDTSTAVQRGLFDASSGLSGNPSPPLLEASSAVSQALSDNSSTPSSNYLIPRSGSMEDHQSGNPKRTPSELSDPDQDPDLDLDSGSEIRAHSPASGYAPPIERPRLVLVPPSTETTEADIRALLSDLAAGSEADPRHVNIREGAHAGLRATISQLTAEVVTTEERRAVGAWVRTTCALGAITGDPFSKLSAWAAIPGALMAALQSVRERARAHDAVRDQLAAFKATIQ